SAESGRSRSPRLQQVSRTKKGHRASEDDLKPIGSWPRRIVAGAFFYPHQRQRCDAQWSTTARIATMYQRLSMRSPSASTASYGAWRNFVTAMTRGFPCFELATGYRINASRGDGSGPFTRSGKKASVGAG